MVIPHVKQPVYGTYGHLQGENSTGACGGPKTQDLQGPGFSEVLLTDGDPIIL